MDTILLDQATWDLTQDANGNIAMASEPYSLAQDAASAIKTFLGEVYFDTTVGVPYMSSIFGKAPSLARLKAQFVAAAKTVPNVSAAQCFITAFDGASRSISGQVQVVGENAQVSAASFFATFAPEPMRSR